MPSHTWTFAVDGPVAWSDEAVVGEVDHARGVHLIEGDARLASLVAPATAPAEADYAFEADVSFRFHRPGHGWVGAVIARRASDGLGILVHYVPGHEMSMYDQRSGMRLCFYYPPVCAGPEVGAATTWQRMVLRLELQRGRGDRLPAVSTLVNGCLIGERLLPPAEFDAAGAHGVSVACSGSVEAVVHRLSLVPVATHDYPLYAARGEAPTEADPLPRSATPAESIHLLEIAHKTFEEAYLGVVLQGLVNRRLPRILTDYRGYESMGNRGDWSALVEAGGRAVVRGHDVWALLERFAGEVRGVVLYERAWTETPALKPLINVVTTACGLDDLVPLTPELYAALPAATRPPVVWDARGRWGHGREALAWSVSEQLPRCSTRAIMHNQIHQPNLANLDYAVAHRLFVFMSALYDGTREELRQYERILTHTAPCTPILGMAYLERMGGWPINYFGEGTMFYLAGELGKYFLYTMSAGNLSYHSGIEHAPRQKPPPAIALERGKIYVCFFSSDGDNLSWSQNFRLVVDGHPSRGRYPLAWSFAPAMAYLCPDIAQYYYDRAPQGERYVGSGGGLGIQAYTHALSLFGCRLEPEARAAAREQYLALTRAAFARADLRVNNPFSTNRDDLELLAAAMPELRLILPGYNVDESHLPRKERIFRTRAGAWVARWVCAHPDAGNPNNPADGASFGRAYAESIRRRAEQGIRFIPVWCLGNLFVHHVDVLNTAMETLGTGFVAVGPEQLAELFDQAEAAGDWGE